MYENDSSDSTRDVLNEWKTKHPHENGDKIVLMYETLKWNSAISHGGFHSKRFTTLAYCRDKYVHRLRQKEYDAASFVIVLDMDLWDMHVDGVAHSFGLFPEHQWASMSANGTYNDTHYYDALAFRSEEFPDTLRDESSRYFAQKEYNPTLPPVEVQSAFGGLCIYRKECFQECNYSATTNDCEHIALHQCQASLGYGKHYMNPAMKLRYHF